MIKVLADHTGGNLACLVNCRHIGDKLYCGLAAFRGGIKGKIEVFSDTEAFTILLPEKLAKVGSNQVFTSIHDTYEIALEAYNNVNYSRRITPSESVGYR